MARRRLSDDEAALWARVMAEVRPLHPGQVASPATAPQRKPPPAAGTPLPRHAPVASSRPAVTAGSAATLDASWERRIGRGRIVPDGVIDLHGHTLASAHAMLDTGLGAAIARGDRILLLVTGKPPAPGQGRPHGRGAIRAAVRDWIDASPHAGRIAAVRGAHPRHGGAGALYIIFRRARTTGSRIS